MSELEPVTELIPTKAKDEFSRLRLVTNAVNNLLSESTSVLRFGAKGDGVANDTTAFQRAIDALPAQGGIIEVPEGDYSTVVPGSLSTGNKAVTWLADKATLPDNMPGVVEKAGVFTLPESSFQADKSVRVHDFREIGETQASSTVRQYGIHIHGYMSDAASDDIRELRAISFDLGTNETYEQADIRGLKGRVYAEGGNANIRAIYGFAEGFDSHTGQITGILGTVHRETGSTGQAVAVRGHVGPDNATSNSCAAFSAGANGTGVQVSYGYMMQPGSNALLPTQSCFLAHGGGTGDLYRGIRTESDTDVIYSVDNAGRQQARSYYSGRANVADDGVATITVSPASGTGGIIIVWIPDVANMVGMGFFRLDSSPFMLSMFEGSLVSFTTGTLTGTTGVDGEMTISARNNGTIQIENRQGGVREIQWMLLHNASQQGQVD